MSDDKAGDGDDAKKGGGGMKMIIGIVVALGVGAGGAYGAFAAGLIGDGGKSGPNHPEFGAQRRIRSLSRPWRREGQG